MQTELVKLVQERTGLPEDKARQAVETVLDFVRARLPEPLGDQLDRLLEAEGSATEDLLGGLGNLLGGLGSK